MKNNNNAKSNKKVREPKIGTYLLEEVITSEEKAILTGISNGMTFDRKSVNEQLRLAREANR